MRLLSKWRGHFTPEFIAYWEQVAGKLAIAVAKFKAEEALQSAVTELKSRVRDRNLELHIANAALRASDELFRQMAENVNEIFWLTSPGFRQVYYISPAFETIWERPCRDVYENPAAWLEAVHPEDQDGVRQMLLGRDSGERVQHEYRIIRPNGSTRWVWDDGSPVRDEDGVVYRIARVVFDTTERKIAETALSRAHRALLVIKDCDEALARVTREADLLETVCQLVLRIEGVKMAWVGFAGDDPK